MEDQSTGKVKCIHVSTDIWVISSNMCLKGLMFQDCLSRFS